MATNIDIITKMATNLDCSQLGSGLYTRQKTKKQDSEGRDKDYVNGK